MAKCKALMGSAVKGLKGFVSPQPLWTVRWGWPYDNSAAGSCHIKKLYSRLYWTEIEFYSKTKKSFFVTDGQTITTPKTALA